MKALLKREMPDYDEYTYGKRRRRRDGERSRRDVSETGRLKKAHRAAKDGRSLKEFAKDHEFGRGWLQRKRAS